MLHVLLCDVYPTSDILLAGLAHRSVSRIATRWSLERERPPCEGPAAKMAEGFHSESTLVSRRLSRGAVLPSDRSEERMIHP